MSLRVLHVMSCRGWSSDAYWAGRIATELEARGHRVTLVAHAGAQDKVLRRLRDLGVSRLVPLAFGHRLAPLTVARNVTAIQRQLDDHDVVHVHRGKEHWLAAAANVMTRRPRPLFRTRHIVAPVGAHTPNRWLYRRTRHVIAVNEAIAARYVSSGLLTRDRVTALPGGVDDRRFHPKVDPTEFRLRHGLADAPVVGVLAGLRPMKGQRVFLEAVRLVRARHPEARYVVAGDGPQTREVRRWVEQLGLADVIVMPGHLADPEAALAAFDVAVSPSLSSEGMGRVIFEYMAMGRPIVASRVGLAAEVLTSGQTAWLVEPDRPEALAQAIDEALSRPDLAGRMAAACRRLVESRYSGAVLAEAIERLYEGAVGGNFLEKSGGSP